MERFIDLPRQTRAAEIRASSYNQDNHTVDVVWTTGASVRRRGKANDIFDEELTVADGAVRLGRLNAGAPLLNTHGDHSLSDVIGSVVPGSARIQNGQGIATIRLSSSPGDADNVQKIRDGIVRSISVGYVIHRAEKIERGNDMPMLLRVDDWEPSELSAVPVPADPGAHVRATEPTETFRCTVVEQDKRSQLASRIRMRMREREHRIIGYPSDFRWILDRVASRLLQKV